MTCYDWQGHSKPLVLIGASYVGEVERRLIISSYIIRLFWGYGTGSSHRLGWCGFNQGVFAIWWLFLLCVLGTLLEAKHFGRLFVSPWCGLCVHFFNKEVTIVSATIQTQESKKRHRRTQKTATTLYLDPNQVTKSSIDKEHSPTDILDPFQPHIQEWIFNCWIYFFTIFKSSPISLSKMVRSKHKGAAFQVFFLFFPVKVLHQL